MRKYKTLKITLSTLAFLVLSSGVAYAASDQGFMRVADAKNLVKESDIDLSKVKGYGHGFSSKMLDKHKDIKAAIINDDYETFSKLVEDSPMQIEISEDTFNKMVEAHALRVAGDYESAIKIMSDLGLKK